MRKRFWQLMMVGLVLTSGPALARDTRYLIKIADVLSMPEAAARLDPRIKLYFGRQPAPPGEDRGLAVANPKTNSANKGDYQACRWVMISALLELQKKARAVGATSVQGIESYYKKVPWTSETEFECHAGTFVTGVALRGRLVK